MRLVSQCAACVCATILLALLEACGASANVQPQPSPKTAEPSYRAYVYSDTPGTLRAFDVSNQTGALELKAEMTPDGEPSAPVSSPGSFVVDPEGAFLFYSFNSCANGGCSNLASYAIGTGAGLTRVHQVGLTPMEGGYTLLACKAFQILVDWDDAPAHGIDVWMFDRSTGVIREVGYVNSGLGYQQQPYSIDIAPNGVWVYGLRTGGLLMGYRLDLVRRVPETHSTRLDGDGARLAVDAAGRFLYVAFQKVSPRIEVWAIDDKGVGVRVGAVATDEGTALEPDPGGRFLYQSTRTGIEVYATDSRSGLLTLRQRADVFGVIELAAHPSGRYLYATRDDGTIWGYRVAPETGALEPLGELARGHGLQFAKRAT